MPVSCRRWWRTRALRSQFQRVNTADSTPTRAASWPRSVGPTTKFAVLDRAGNEVSLRYPEVAEILCAECVQQYALGRSAVDPAHRCEDSFTDPLWIVTDSRCATDGFGVAAHLHSPTAPTTCACGVVDLYTAMENLDAVDRQAAVDAHIAHIRALYSHLLAAEACRDGVGMETHLPSACARCFFDSAHAEVIDADLVHTSAQLALVLRSYEAHLSIGARTGHGQP